MLKFGLAVLGCIASSVFGGIDVVCSEFSPAQQDELRLVASSVEEQIFEVFGVDVGAIEDGALIEIHLLHRDYRNAVKLIDEDGLDGGYWAYVNSDVGQAHVALQPPVPSAMLEAAGVPLQTKIQMAQSLVHLCVARVTNNHRSHPDWLSEGLAVHLASKALRSAGMMGGVNEEPWTSTELIQISKLLEENPDFGVASIMADETKEDSKRAIYAVRGALIAWIDDLGLLEDVAGEARRFGGGEKYADRLSAYVLETLADAGVENPDAAFRAWIDSFSPQWEQVYRSLETTGDVWAHGAFSSKNAVCWNTEELGDGDWAITGSMMIFEGEKTQMNILMGRSDVGFMSVAVSTAGMSIFDYKKDADKKWTRLARKEIRNLSTGEWINFKISKRRDRLMVKIGKHRAERVDLNGLDVSGPWGLGVQNKSSGLWRDVKVEKK